MASGGLRFTAPQRSTSASIGSNANPASSAASGIFRSTATPAASGRFPGTSEAANENLDMSDFPALGGGASNSTLSNNQPSTASYSAQLNNPASLAVGSTAVAPHRDFTPDDFPALNGVVRDQQEQESAAAALAHRQNLQGIINLNQQQQVQRPLAQGQFPPGIPQDDQKQRNYATKLANSQQWPLGNGALTNGHESLSPNAAQNLLSPTPSAAAQLISNLQSNPLSQLSPASHPLPPLPSANPMQPPGFGLPSQTRPPPPDVLPITPAHQVLASPADRFGLLGLVNIIKMSQDPDIALLALGTDLERLGLDMNATQNLHQSFVTPWTDNRIAEEMNIEPEFHLPACYNVQPPPASSKLQNYTDETLFYIFYSQPRDMMQEAAAEQLYKRNWRYHKDLHLWLTKEAGTEPIQKTQTYERGSYIFFDPTEWDRVKKDFVLVFDQLETRHRTTGQQGLPSM